MERGVWNTASPLWLPSSEQPVYHNLACTQYCAIKVSLIICTVYCYREGEFTWEKLFSPSIYFSKRWYLPTSQHDITQKTSLPPWEPQITCWDFRFSRRRVWGWLSSGLLRRVVWYKLADVSEVLTAPIIRAITMLMEAVWSSETSVNYQTTRRNIPEDILK
jgi:hypothetical protein